MPAAIKRWRGRARVVHSSNRVVLLRNDITGRLSLFEKGELNAKDAKEEDAKEVFFAPFALKSFFMP